MGPLKLEENGGGHQKSLQRVDASSSVSAPPILTSDLGCPIKNLLDFTREDLKKATSDWPQAQGLGACVRDL